MRALSLGSEPYHFNMILSCDIYMTVNQHFTAAISGYISGTDDEIVEVAMRNSNLIIYAEENEKSKSLFRGRICHLKIQEEGGLKILTVKAESNTAVLDEEMHTRSFQDTGYTYQNIADLVIKKTEKAGVIYYSGKEEQADGLVVQYEETDWMFLKRLAGRVHTVLVPDCTNDFICFYFGIPRKKEKAVWKSKDFDIAMEYSGNYLKNRVMEYQVVSREIWELCTPVQIQGKELLVYAVQGNLDGGEMIWQYRLRRMEDFGFSEPWNQCITGVSLFGKVLESKNDMVRLELECEDDFKRGEGIWFPYATVYASIDGNGWYFMPDEGVKVRLCFPDKNEGNAYVASATYLEDVMGEKNNPEIKFIRTAQGKEIRLAPDYILITNHKGMSIRLDDECGIMIRSSGNIELVSDNGVNLFSEGEICMDSQSGVLLKQGENSFTIKEGIRARGMRVRFQ